MISIEDQFRVLFNLGHALPLRANEDLAVAVKRFQKHVGLVPDGVVGPKTAGKLKWYRELLNLPAFNGGIATPFRVTQYHFAEERDSGLDDEPLPILGVDGGVIAYVRPKFFSEAALEGSGILLDGRTINVAGKYVTVRRTAWIALYRPVVRRYNLYAEKQRSSGKEPKPTRYFGFDFDENPDGVMLVQAFRFRDDINKETPYGKGKLGIPFTPYGTMAVDTGYKGWNNPDPRYKGKGGLIPPGTEIYHIERGVWYRANDTGGGIYGAHVDEFVGTRELMKLYPSFPRAHLVVMLPDRAERFPVDYNLGLY